MPDDDTFSNFWNRLRDDCLKVRRGVESSPNGFHLAPFDASFTQRIKWLQRQVINPIETLEAALAEENAPHFAHWEQYGATKKIGDEALLASLLDFKERTACLQLWLKNEVDAAIGGVRSHTYEVRFHIVHECLLALQECYPAFKITRGNWDKELGTTIGIVPDYVRRIFYKTTGQNEQLDGQIQEVIKSL